MIAADPIRPGAEARFLDGVTARIRPAAIRIDDEAETLVIHPDAAAAVTWPLEEIRRLPDRAGSDQMVLLRRNAAGRLIVTDGALRAALGIRCRHLHRSQARPPLGRLALLGGAAAGAVALVAFVLVPALGALLADRMPVGAERALGRASVRQVAVFLGQDGPARFCEAPEGRAALQRMTAALSEGADLPHPLSIGVLATDMENAVALPGGQILLFDGLLQVADSPDEVAAVLAHEIGHVAARDPVRVALQATGSAGVLGLLLGDFAGGAAIAFLTDQMVAARYSQAAETAADAYAATRMRTAGADPGAFADILERIAAEGGGRPPLLDHIARHPRTAARIAAAEAARNTGADPILGAADWVSLRGICAAAPPPAAPARDG